MHINKITRQDLWKLIYILMITLIVISVFLITGCTDNSVTPVNDSNGLEYVTPEEVGYSSAKLEEVKQFTEQSGFDAIMAVYDGKVFFTWGEIDKNYWCHSIRKPFLSALYGIHFANGSINLDATLEELGIDDIPPSLTQEEKQAIVRELLQSRSGVYHEAAAESDAMTALRPTRGSHPHGTFYYYNNWDFNAAGVIFNQETGRDIFEEFKSKIADPIGMQDFSVGNCNYQYELNKSMHPAYPFRMSTRDMARFGVLYQKNGTWQGKQIISPEWITESLTAYSILDSTLGVGYGYMWKLILPGGAAANQLTGGHSVFFHTGLGGVQAMVIIPDLKLVIIERTNTDGYFIDKELGMEIGMMIINAKNN